MSFKRAVAISFVTICAAWPALANSSPSAEGAAATSLSTSAKSISGDVAGDSGAATPDAKAPAIESGDTAAVNDAAKGEGEEVQVAANSAKPVKAAAVATTLKASIDLSTQTMTISEHGVTSYTFAISSGTRKYATPTGTFRPQWMARHWNSRKYDWAPMPYSVFIHGGIAIHGTTHTGALGRPASHGCIRLSTGNARTFFNLVSKHGKKATRVTVYGRPNYGSTPVASSSRRKRTYQASNDSWFFSGSGSAYDPNFTRRKTRGAQRAGRPFRIVRMPDGRKRKVYVQKPTSSFWDNW